MRFVRNTVRKLICSYPMLCRTVLCIVMVCVLLLSSNKLTVALAVANKMEPSRSLFSLPSRSLDRDLENNSDGIVKISSTSQSNSNGMKFNQTRSLLEEFIKKIQPSNITMKPKAIYNPHYDMLREFSETQIDNTLTAFGVPILDSLTFKRQFLICAGTRLVLQQFVNITNEGNVVMPKHFQKCKSMSFQKNRKTVALLSFPGSGNSWVRQLIETTTGIYTGAYQDCDDSYIFNGMIGEGIYTDNVIAVKMHYVPGSHKLSWLQRHNVIYVVRNPFDAILSEWNRRNSAQHLIAHVSTTTAFDGRWDELVVKLSNRWKNHVQQFLGSTKSPILVVKYENLFTDLHTELKRMIEFLKFPYTEDDLQCTIKSAVEGFHRKHKNVTDPYTPEQRKLVLTQIKLANEVLRHYNIKY